MTASWLAGVVFAAVLSSAATPDVGVDASYEAPKSGVPGAIVVRLIPRSPDIRVDQQPAPRLSLGASSVLVDRQAPPPVRVNTPVLEPDFARYLDPAVPLRFAVTPDPQAPKGTHTVLATVNFAYCSKSQGWCKRGKEPVELSVTIR
jgi:hypothetical protein